MKMTRIQMTGLALFGLLGNGLVWAQTATDLKCDGCVQSTDIATNGVRRSNIQNFAVNTPKLNNFAVTAEKIKTGAVNESKIEDGAVTTAKIADGAVTSVKVSAELAAAGAAVGNFCAPGEAMVGINPDGSIACVAGRLAPTVFDASGTEIGQLISIGENFWNFVAINQSGYIQNVSFQDGALGQGALVYLSSDCSGTPYAIDTFGGHVQIYFDSFGNPNLYYVDKAAEPVSDFTSGSLSFAGECFVQTDFRSFVWPVTINDPAITGISSMSYSLPIRIDRAN